MPFDADTPPPELGRLAAETPERWRTVDRSRHAPRLVLVPDDAGEGVAGAALVTARPDTAYLKIVDAIGDVRAAVRAVVAHARRLALAQVKWEGWTVSPAVAESEGFTALIPPLAQPQDSPGPPAGYVRWLSGATVPEPRYYGQSTHFTCGAVTALVARAHAGHLPWTALDRRAELTLWRDATNFPSCEPVGLGLAVHRAWPESAVTVHLDSEDPLFLDHLTDPERAWRTVLQDVSREEAARAGVPVRSERLTLAAIRSGLDRRQPTLLLLSLDRMQGYDVPHWVLCHAAVPGALVIDDPWAETSRGDTWVDAHLLPVPEDSLDAMSTLSPGPFRGAVTLGPGAAYPGHPPPSSQRTW
ncbi:peptidase C39 family protein [Streptomyces sp. NPDC058867]|uniref:peptidase C39 family protein n=1 Tax=unclassified Streptomyces TaxID=2593676 RepID=UPI0036B2036A